MKKDRRQYTNEWHLDKRVVISIITIVVSLVLAIATQTTVLFRWGSSVQSAIDQQAAINKAFETRLSELAASEKDSVRLAERVVRVETMLESVQHTVNKIDIAIDPVVRQNRNNGVRR